MVSSDLNESNSGARSEVPKNPKSVYMRGPKEATTYSIKKSVHPFLCRLRESAHFSVSSPKALVSAGFASLWMGLFTLFRPTPIILYSLIIRTKNIQDFGKITIIVLLFTWQGVIMFVLLFLGFLLTISTKVKKRWVLLLHPWGLLLLYVDAAVWIFIGLSLHLESVFSKEPAVFNNEVQFPIVYFIIVYVESTCFCLVHYIYATYFIAAELTVIERFFF